MAEGVVRKMSSLQVDSAGTAAYHIGAPPDPRARRAAQSRGIDLRARQVQAQDFERFDLILGMDRANLTELKKIRPLAAKAEMRLFLDFAPHVCVREVPDPYYGGDQDFEQVLDLCFEAGRGLIEQFT
jgi:protein-tyrosine phosphatase